MAEFSIRGLVRRIDTTERELRELVARAGRHFYVNEGDRRARVRVLRRWLKQDQGKLRALLGAKIA